MRKKKTRRKTTTIRSGVPARDQLTRIRPRTGADCVAQT